MLPNRPPFPSPRLASAHQRNGFQRHSLAPEDSNTARLPGSPQRHSLALEAGGQPAAGGQQRKSGAPPVDNLYRAAGPPARLLDNQLWNGGGEGDAPRLENSPQPAGRRLDRNRYRSDNINRDEGKDRNRIREKRKDRFRDQRSEKGQE